MKQAVDHALDSSPAARWLRSPVQLGVLAVMLGVVGYGIYEVINLWWVCDDAFISYRYAQNLVRGLGLVYNAGEHVEGYTNFLWTVFVAGGMWLKLEPILFSNILSALSFFGTVCLLGWLSYRLFTGEKSEPRLFLPLAALALLLHHDCLVFATSGLETSFDTFLITAGFCQLILGKSSRASLWAGLLLILAAATRPDSMAFYVMGGVYVFVVATPRFKSVLLYLLPVIFLYLPYWILRYHYYGWPFPNTYYAKSASLPYYSQGIVYLWLYFKSYYVLLLVPLGLIAALALRRRDLIAFPVRTPVARTLLLILLFCVPYTFYVVRSGGDFMFARFFIPITPLLFLTLETSLRLLLARTRILVVAAAVVLALVLARWDPFTADRTVSWIANEPAFYPPDFVKGAQETGALMKRAFAGTDARVSFRGMYAMYVYYSEVPVAIEGQTGLTDEFIAHQTLKERGRPGHEKVAPLEYLYSREVNFLIHGGVSPKRMIDSLTCIYFGTYPAYILVFKNELMDHLKQFPEIQFTDVRELLDFMIAQLKVKRDPRILEAYGFLRNYYFEHNDDPEREKWFKGPPDP